MILKVKDEEKMTILSFTKTFVEEGILNEEAVAGFYQFMSACGFTKSQVNEVLEEIDLCGSPEGDSDDYPRITMREAFESGHTWLCIDIFSVFYPRTIYKEVEMPDEEPVEFLDDLPF